MGCGASKKQVETPAETAFPAEVTPKVKAPAAAEPKVEKPAVETPAPAVTKAPAAAVDAAPAEAAPAETTEEAAPAADAEAEPAAAGKFKLNRGAAKPQTPLEKFHSALRWNKLGLDGIKELIAEDDTLPTQKDEKNGNQALHLTCQNGHLDLTTWLIDDCGVDVNAANNKGQTALHMSIAYDFYGQTDYLVEKGADKEATNSDGNTAWSGIDGDHTGKWEHGSVMHKFKAVSDVDSMNAAFDGLEAAETDMLDKLTLVQTGMRLKKTLGDDWPADRFAELCKKAPAAE